MVSYLLTILAPLCAFAGTYNYTGDDPNCICESEIPGWCRVNFGAHVKPTCTYPSALPWNGPQVNGTAAMAEAASKCEADSQCNSFHHRGNIQYCTQTGDFYGDAECCIMYKQASKCLSTTADPNHCATAGCDGQMVCNTETGECEAFDCDTHGCDDQLVCNTETGECERDCDILHIDDFLLQCSAEWDSNTASNTAMASSIATNTANIATVTASAATNADDIATNTASAESNAQAITTATNLANTNAAAIATNTGDIATVTGSANTNSAGLTAMGTRMDSVESRLSAIELTLSRLAIVSAHSSIGDVDVSTAADLEDDGSWTAMTLNGKDVVIVGMLAVNAVLLTSMAVVCCRKQRGQQKYQAVTIASD